MWHKLPRGFLKKQFDGWRRLDYGVRELIVTLAEKQKFKCALCDTTHRLIIEHDHEPFEGPGAYPTVKNVRGLVCQRCNHQIRLYERDRDGEFWGLSHVSSWLTDYQYEVYIDDYECRVEALRDAERKARMEPANYYYRQSFLMVFDDWKEGWWPKHTWRHHLREVKDRRRREIRSPMQFLQNLKAIMQFVANELKKDPNFDPGDRFVELMVRVRPIFEEALQQREAKARLATGRSV